VDALAGLRSGVDAEQENFGSAGACRSDHPFAETKLHLSRLEISDDDYQSAFELLKCVRSLDPGENCASHISAQTDGQFYQLLRLWDFFGLDHSRDSQVNFSKIFDRACGS
jgi:hypothetical protein